MDLYPGDITCDWGRLQIVDDAGRRSSNQDNVIGEKGGVEFPRQDVGGGDEPIALRGCIVKPYPAGRIGRYCQRADADRRQARPLAETLLGVCASRTTDIAGRSQGYPKRLCGERR